MSLDNLTKRIFSDAHKTKDALLENAEKEVARIKEDTEQEKNKLLEAAQKDLQKVLEENEKRIRAAGRHQEKVLIAKTKRDVLDSIFHKAIESLDNLSEKEYESFIKKLLNSLSLEKGATLIISPDRKKETENVLRELHTSLDVKEDKNLGGGFVLTSGDISYNFTFQHIVETQKEELLVELAQKIFEE